MKKQEESKLKEINNAANILKNGGIVVFPTDTVFGMGCLVDNSNAIKKLRNIKASHQNFPILVSSIQEAKKYTKPSTYAEKLMQKFWPGALTIIVKDKMGKTLGVRMPDSKLTLTLIKKTGKPIIGTSANFHTKPAPKSVGELDPNLLKKANYFLIGKCKNMCESTVIDTTVNPPKILRFGAIDINEVEN